MARDACIVYFYELIYYFRHSYCR